LNIAEALGAPLNASSACLAIVMPWAIVAKVFKNYTKFELSYSKIQEEINEE
jgi:hypothetical protein